MGGATILEAVFAGPAGFVELCDGLLNAGHTAATIEQRGQVFGSGSNFVGQEVSLGGDVAKRE